MWKWIFRSDQVLALLSADPATITLVQSYKGAAFVMLGALLVYLLIDRHLQQRDRLEAALRRSNRAYRTLSAGNRTLVRSASEAELVMRICRVIVEEGGNRAAWVGLRQGEEELRTAGYWGLEPEEAGQLERLFAQSADGTCPITKALRGEQAVVQRCPGRDGRSEPACPAPLHDTPGTALALPMRSGGLRGVLVLFSPDQEAFSGEEPKLFEDLAADLRFGLDALRRREREREHQQRLRLAGSVFGATAEGIMVVNADERILQVNPAFTDITGYPPEEAVGATPRILHSGYQDRNFYRAMWGALKQVGIWQGEIWNRRRDGESYPEWLTINSVHDQHGEVSHYIGVFTDLSRVRQLEEGLEFLTYHDPLTRLPNRRLLDQRLEHALDRARRDDHGTVAVICLDLDALRQINDSFGHAAGDALLQQLANRLQRSLRAEDTVARLSADDFAVLLEDVDAEAVPIIVAQKHQKIFHEPLQLDEQSIRLTASAGVAVFPGDGDNPATLIRNADAAMHQAKREGRGALQFFSEKLTAAAANRVFLEQSLQEALESEQFRVLYQPQFDFASRRTRGVEALVRWEHPEQGLIKPERFIPAAEDTGLIVAIGEWVLETACRQAAAWRDAGLDIDHVAVNVSGGQVQRGDLTGTVAAVLERSGLPAAMLELELTEQVLMHKGTGIEQTLHELRGQGVALAVDDFGTGYSSLSYLRRLPVTKLKIGKSFVDDVPGDGDAEAIVRAIIALAGSLRLEVCAEGIETAEQTEFLLTEGCGEGQGYLYSRPVSASEVESLLERHGSGRH